MSDIIVDSINQLLKKESYRRIWVAYSGGVDSHVLLSALEKIIPGEQISAIHINHNLSPESEQWQQHCARVCDQLSIAFHSASVSIASQGDGIEAAARKTRYQVFEQCIGENDLLLMAHHLDDQIETFFLRLMRGAGVDGLSAMPEIRQLAQGRIGRPLLSINKAQIENYARQNQLDWIEDESNAEEKFDRNFLRNQVLPLISTRWPMYRKPVARTIELMQQAKKITGRQVNPELQHRLTADNGLKTPGLLEMDRVQAINLLREWIRFLNEQSPSQLQLSTILDQVVAAQQDAQPKLVIKDYSIRRFKTAIYLVKPLESIEQSSISLDGETEVAVKGAGNMKLVKSQLTNIRVPLIAEHFLPLQVRFSHIDLRITPVGRNGSRDLKRLLQEYRVKPWIRSRIPLLFSGENLVAVGDLFVVEGYQAQLNETGYSLCWKQP